MSDGRREGRPRPGGGANDRSVVLYDDVCDLCDGVVRFVIDHDPNERFAFAPLQSAYARERLAGTGIDPVALEGVVLIEGGHVRTRSDAALAIAAGLRRPWPWLAALRVVPRPALDAAYDAVARHRYRFFGRRDACRRPTPAEARRFVATADAETDASPIAPSDAPSSASPEETGDAPRDAATDERAGRA